MIKTCDNFTNMKINTHCICGEIDRSEHIYICEILNSSDITNPYIDIFSNDILKIKPTYMRMKESLKMRKDILEAIPCDPWKCDPLFINVVSSNGPINYKL